MELSKKPLDTPSITLVDASVPSLKAGKYKLTATQSLKVKTSEGVSEDKKFDGVKEFYVRGPRFSLAPDEIYSVYPPDNQEGPYHQTLPHVVFRRKSVPWERSLDATKGQVPWMALLVFVQDDDSGEISDGQFIVCSYQEVVKPPSGTQGPCIKLDPWEETSKTTDPEKDGGNRCTILDVPWDLFFKVVPRKTELGYLAHARSVATGTHKEDIPGIGDGWFSVVLANRLPAEGKRNIAVLVSLEGHEDLIQEKPPESTPGQVRLIVLAKWAFVSNGPTFEERLKTLFKEKDPWLRTSADSAELPALALGHVPLEHGLRQGDRTISWYRGPLVPFSIPARTDNLIFVNADEALQFDKETGLFDVSYAAAWQLGRLLALQSSEFAPALFQWMNGGSISEAVLKNAVDKFNELFPHSPADLNHAIQLQQDDLMIAIALELTE